LTSLASNAVATVVIALSEQACDRQVLLRTLDGQPVAAQAAAADDTPASALANKLG